MVAADVNDVGAFRCAFQDEAEEFRVLLFPRSRFAQLPSVNDIAIEDECLASVVLEKVNDFFRFGGRGAQVQVGKDDGAVACFFHRSWVLQINPGCFTASSSQLHACVILVLRARKESNGKPSFTLPENLSCVNSACGNFDISLME